MVHRYCIFALHDQYVQIIISDIFNSSCDNEMITTTVWEDYKAGKKRQRWEKEEEEENSESVKNLFHR